MAKKTFKAAVIETQQHKLQTLIPTTQPADIEAEMLAMAQQRKAAGLGVVGRPKRKDKDNKAASAAERGTKPGETRKTYLVNIEKNNLLERIAYQERISVKEALDEALTAYIEQYIKAKGTPLQKRKK